MSQSIRILVLCTGNSCRSQMAEALFRHFGAGKVEAFSAGLKPKAVHPKAIQVMQELGIDISHQKSNHLSEFLSEQFDYVITVCDNAASNCPVFPGEAERLHWPFDDPDKATGSEDEILSEFRRVRDEIATRIRTELPELLAN
ncbi:MAG: arsenate reductase ArsC [bacterium]|nr:arsenate reductase ArsC [bacterium]